MNLSDLSEICKKSEEKLLQQGREEMRVFVEYLLKHRFGDLDDALLSAIKRLLQLPPQESSRLILQSSREELLAKLT
jgi:hypothetical protein